MIRRLCRLPEEEGRRLQSMNLDQFPFKQVAKWLVKGMIVPFLGAGASRVGVPDGQRLPDARGLAHELVTKMEGAYLGEATDDLAKVAQVFEQSVFDRDALYEYVHERFYRAQEGASLSRVAEFLASLSTGGQPLFLVTTNYDSIIEQSFHAAGRPICVITQNMRDPLHGIKRVNVTLPRGGQAEKDSDDFLWDDYNEAEGTVFLFKMHGSAERRIDGRDDLIVTENDYIDFLVNAGGVAPLFPPASLLNAYRTRRFLFLGYSLQDWNFRAFLRLLVTRNALSGHEKLRHFSIQLRPGEIDAQLWRHRNVNVYNGDLMEFCDRITRVLPPGRAAS
jgi:hypothetical protein